MERAPKSRRILYRGRGRDRSGRLGLVRQSSRGVANHRDDWYVRGSGSACAARGDCLTTGRGVGALLVETRVRDGAIPGRDTVKKDVGQKKEDA